MTPRAALRLPLAPAPRDAEDVEIRWRPLAQTLCEACGVYAGRVAWHDGGFRVGRWCAVCRDNLEYSGCLL